MRLYNGDISFDFQGAVDVMLSISAVLTTTTEFQSVRLALRQCIERSKSPGIFVEYQWQVEVVRDVEMCLRTQGHVFRALSEAIAMTKEAKRKKPNLKLRFFFAWAQTLTLDILRVLRESVHDYYTSLTALLVHVHASS
jgi:hypothetical protein